MPIGKLTIEISIPHAQSLKDRRQAMRSLKDTVRNGFNASVAELDEGTVWNRGTVGVVAISGSMSYLTGQMEQLEQAAHRACNAAGAEILDCWVEILEE